MGSWSFVAAGVSKELVATKASTRSFRSLRVSMVVRFYVVRPAVHNRRYVAKSFDELIFPRCAIR